MLLLSWWKQQIYTNRQLTRKRRARKRQVLEMINELYKQNDEGADHIIPGLQEQIRQVEQDAIQITDEDFHNCTWRNDAGERARRVYDWWRMLMNEKKTHLPFFQNAIRLVVLTQPSSASCERVFSQLTYIRRIVGDATLGEMLELRALLRCNNGLVVNY